MKHIFKNSVDVLEVGFIIVAVIIGAVGLFRSCNKRNSETTSPVKECRIDSAKNANTILILEVEQLDSIKYVKSIEATTLDNDSTLELFYELIRK